ncbi:hypothetical protein Tco_1170563 [Tanacetum coccineum]
MAPLTFANTHNMVTYLSKSDASEGFDQILDFLNASTIRYALTVNPTIYVSCIKQFWSTAKVKTVNGMVQLQALIDGKKVFISEAIIKRDLHLEDAEGLTIVLQKASQILYQGPTSGIRAFRGTLRKKNNKITNKHSPTTLYKMSQPANDEFSQHLSDDEASNHEDASDTGAAPKQQQVIPQTTAISNIKLPILKKEEYDI